MSTDPRETCEECGAALRTRRIPAFREDALIGLPGVVLRNAVDETVCPRCKASRGLTLTALGRLHATIAQARILHPAKLDAPAIRFLRKWMGWPAKTAAARLSVRPETVSRWENAHEAINEPAEKLLRILVGGRLVAEGYLETFDPATNAGLAIESVRPAGKPVELVLELRPRRQVWRVVA